MPMCLLSSSKLDSTTTTTTTTAATDPSSSPPNGTGVSHKCSSIKSESLRDGSSSTADDDKDTISTPTIGSATEQQDTTMALSNNNNDGDDGGAAGTETTTTTQTATSPHTAHRNSSILPNDTSPSSTKDPTVTHPASTATATTKEEPETASLTSPRQQRQPQPLDLVRDRIVALVRRHGTSSSPSSNNDDRRLQLLLDAARLPALYARAHRAPLPLQEFGKLRGLLEACCGAGSDSGDGGLQLVTSPQGTRGVPPLQLAVVVPRGSSSNNVNSNSNSNSSSLLKCADDAKSTSTDATRSHHTSTAEVESKASTADTTTAAPSSSSFLSSSSSLNSGDHPAGAVVPHGASTSSSSTTADESAALPEPAEEHHHHHHHHPLMHTQTSASLDQVSVGSSTTFASHGKPGDGDRSLVVAPHPPDLAAAAPATSSAVVVDARQVRHRVRVLVAEHAANNNNHNCRNRNNVPGLDACKLPGLYRHRYRAPLPLGALGYARLRPFLETVPGLEVRESPRPTGPPLLLRVVPGGGEGGEGGGEWDEESGNNIQDEEEMATEQMTPTVQQFFRRHQEQQRYLNISSNHHQSQSQWMVPPASTTEPPQPQSLELVKERLVDILSHHHGRHGLDAAKLPGLYRYRFRAPLPPPEQFGYAKLRNLLENVPALQVQTHHPGAAGRPPVTVQLRNRQLREQCLQQNQQLLQQRLSGNGSSNNNNKSCEVISSTATALPSTGSVPFLNRGGTTATTTVATANAIVPYQTTHDLSVVKKRIVELVGRNAPLDACQLPILYKSCYRETLDVGALGFGRLRELLESMPRIKLATARTGPPLRLSLQPVVKKIKAIAVNPANHSLLQSTKEEEVEEQQPQQPLSSNEEKSAWTSHAEGKREDNEKGDSINSRNSNSTNDDANSNHSSSSSSSSGLNPNAPSYLDVAIRAKSHGASSLPPAPAMIPNWEHPLYQPTAEQLQYEACWEPPVIPAAGWDDYHYGGFAEEQQQQQQQQFEESHYYDHHQQLHHQQQQQPPSVDPSFYDESYYQPYDPVAANAELTAWEVETSQQQAIQTVHEPLGEEPTAAVEQEQQPARSGTTVEQQQKQHQQPGFCQETSDDEFVELVEEAVSEEDEVVFEEVVESEPAPTAEDEKATTEVEKVPQMVVAEEKEVKTAWDVDTSAASASERKMEAPIVKEEKAEETAKPPSPTTPSRQTKKSFASPVSVFCPPGTSPGSSPVRRPFAIGEEQEGKNSTELFEGMACLGYSADGDLPIYINTEDPFCLATIGAQGTERSHTLNCVLENCLLQSSTGDVVRRSSEPMSSLVLHYGQSASSVCKAAGLLTAATPLGPCVSESKATVLVSPTYFKQRKTSYGDSCSVVPLLFKWSSMTVDYIMRILQIGTAENQLDVALFMPLLRRYQRRNALPEFSQFVQEMTTVKGLDSVQQDLLDQQIGLLEYMVAESEVNQEIASEGMDLQQALSSGFKLMIVDLTDPLISREEVNTIFQVVVEEFRTIPATSNKLLALDEAHTFLKADDGLSTLLIDLARGQDTVRLALSTESPKVLAPELLGLCTATLLHHFQGNDWWAYLQDKLDALPASEWERVLSLKAGEALMVAPRSTTRTTQLTMRPALTGVSSSL